VIPVPIFMLKNEGGVCRAIWLRDRRERLLSSSGYFSCAAEGASVDVLRVGPVSLGGDIFIDELD
jgi:hypothetical protein